MDRHLGGRSTHHEGSDGGCEKVRAPQELALCCEAHQGSHRSLCCHTRKPVTDSSNDCISHEALTQEESALHSIGRRSVAEVAAANACVKRSLRCQEWYDIHLPNPVSNQSPTPLHALGDSCIIKREAGALSQRTSFLQCSCRCGADAGARPAEAGARGQPPQTASCLVAQHCAILELKQRCVAVAG